jgi:glycosyltransferase involved in cell wall biosynthesis
MGYLKIRYSLLRRIISNCADIVIGLCQSELDRINPENKGVIIPNFVNFDKFNNESVAKVNLREQLGILKDTKIIAMLGWNTPAKGALTLMRAFIEIKDKHPDCVLVFFGEGPRQPDVNKLKIFLRTLTGKKNLRIDLQKLIDDNELSSRVFFPGVIFDIASYIAEVDIIAAPFTEPHFARPILEAGAMKTIVVTSDIDGTREMVLNGKAGYLSKLDNVSDLATQLDKAISNDNYEKINLMYQNTIKTYNSEINAKNTIKIYHKLLNKDN